MALHLGHLVRFPSVPSGTRILCLQTAQSKSIGIVDDFLNAEGQYEKVGPKRPDPSLFQIESLL